MRKMCTKKSKIKFHFDWEDHWLNPCDAEKEARTIMHRSAGRMMSVQSFFNDLSLYNWLKSRKGCASVDLIRVTVFYNNMFVFGLQATYRATMSNGVYQDMAAERHFFRSGIYGSMGGSPKMSVVELAEDEYIKDVRTRQGELVDRVMFVTNRRTIAFGGTGGVPERPRDYSGEIMSRVIAFTGTKAAGGLERLGYYLEPINWAAIRPMVLMRKLLELDRAELSSSSHQELSKDEAVTAMVLMYADDDIFRNVLSFNTLPLAEEGEAYNDPAYDATVW